MFAALARAVERRLGGFAAGVHANTYKSELIEIATTALGIAWAFSFAGMLTTSVLETIHEVVTHVGHTFDTLHAEKSARTSISVDGPYNVAKH